MKDAARTRAVAAQENRAPATPRQGSSIILLISGDGAPKTARGSMHTSSPPVGDLQLAERVEDAVAALHAAPVRQERRHAVQQRVFEIG